MNQKLLRFIIYGVIFGALVYLAMVFFADYELVLQSVNSFDWSIIPLLLFLSLLNYFIRFLKWQYYIGALKINLSVKDSVLIFFSGLVMSISPAKSGEVIKPYLIKQLSGESLSKTIPIVFAERITDFIGMILLASLGIFFFNYGETFIVLSALLFLFLIILISQKKWLMAVFDFFEKRNFLKNSISQLRVTFENSYFLLRFSRLISMVLLSVLSWIFECLSLYIILREFDDSVSFIWSVFIYAFSTIVGALSFLPGGLGITEGSLTYLIHNNGFTMNAAVISTFLIRVVTLWFAVVVGAISMMVFQKRLGKSK